MKTAASADASGGIDPRILKICFIMMIGSVAPALDSTIVDVAVQTMGTELGAPISAVQWVVTAYILAMGITVPLAGWLDNRFSLKRIYIISLAVFFAGSTLAGMSKSIVSLIVFRVIQGSGAGVLLPTLQSAIIHYAWKQKLALGRLMSIVGVPMLIVPILGPVIGGFIVNSLPWRWIFYVNIPVCAIGLLLALRLPITEPVNRKQPIDIIGNLTLSAVFILIILGVSDIQNNGSASNMHVNPALPGLALLAVYVAYALKTKGEPAINVRLYRYGSFSASSALYFTSAIVWMGTLFIMPLFFQQARNETSFNAGLLLAPQGIGMIVTRGMAGKITDRSGARFIVTIGLGAVVLGTLPFLFATPETSFFLFIAALLVRGAGLGCVNVPIMATVYNGLKKEEITQGTIAARLLQQIGGAFGTAILAALYQYYLRGGNSPQAVTGAFRLVFAWTIGFTVISIIPALMLPYNKRNVAADKNLEA